MTSNKAPLRLDDYWVDQITLKHDGLDDESGNAESSPAPIVDWDIYDSPEGQAFLVEMTIRFRQRRASAGLSGKLGLSGVFLVESDQDETQTQRLLNMNAPSILFGIARGVLGSATALMPENKYVLPSVNFVELIEKRAKRASRKKAQV